MQTFEKVCKIVSENLGLGPDFNFSMDTTWHELDADSLDLVEIIMEIEYEFDISIPDEDVAAMQCMGELVNYIDA